MGKSTISMAIFNSYVKLPEGNPYFWRAAEVHSWKIRNLGWKPTVNFQAPTTADVTVDGCETLHLGW